MPNSVTPPPLTAEQVARFLAGSCDTAEEAAIRARLRAQPALAGTFEDAWAALDGGLAPLAADEVEQSLVVLRETLEQKAGQYGVNRTWPLETASPPRTQSIRKHPLRLGTLSLGEGTRSWSSVFATLGPLPYTLLFSGTLCVLAGMVLSLVSRVSSDTIPAHTYSTGTGQRSIIMLVDGSRVTLAPASRLVVNTGFGRAARVVDLQGEAYFSVPSAEHAPFIVRTGSVTTRVLGTVFNVRRYSTDSALQVSVVSGRVSVGNTRSRIVLSAGRLGIVTDSTTMQTGDAHRSTEWTRGRLVFDDTPVPVMLAALGRWYGYDFRIADSTLKSVNVKAEFREGDSAEMLQLLKRMLHVTLRFDGNIVTLQPNGSQLPPRRATPVPQLNTSIGVGK
jgi:ferric-dicitrate binding protein FerR (iron transport regulator)